MGSRPRMLLGVWSGAPAGERRFGESSSATAIRFALGGVPTMTDKKVWFITGAGRGMGVDIAKAAMAGGNAVVATARNTDTVSTALGQNDDLLAVKLDVTDPTDAHVSVRAAMDRFGRIDVL